MPKYLFIDFMMLISTVLRFRHQIDNFNRVHYEKKKKNPKCKKRPRFFLNISVIAMGSFRIKVPASSANIGPGFDVLGVGLNLYLEIFVKVDPSLDTSNEEYNVKISYEGDNQGFVSLRASKNLISSTALYILRCNGIHSFPNGTEIKVINPIPLGRGLGSSASAIVGGIILGNEIGNLKLSKRRLLDYCLMIERHPDNISAAMLGGFVGSYLNELSDEESKAKNVPLDFILPREDTPKGKIVSQQPPVGICEYLQYEWAIEIKCVAVIPEFEVSTHAAREVLPSSYSRDDIVFNLQRLAILTSALTQSPPNNNFIYEAMRDKIHQPYRSTLIPGLQEVLNCVTPKSDPGLCGICLSGAGPTILCLATKDFESIAQKVINIFKKANVKCSWKLLTVAKDGATVDYLD
ncbi:uncharacterized protein PRCAT00005992001 [Priceomyces carsonii]|uniref:uncharacterized protein n=1 Tax=Priceomyces carsonii TaxID=28549 RepID=UPI002EDB255B|nr:unnamed protein product [Priceomyces carsonii]